MQEQTAALAGELSARYGAGVAVEYVEVYSREMFEGHLDVLRLIAANGLKLPLISIGGKPRFAGGISLPMICGALEKLGLRPVDMAPA